MITQSVIIYVYSQINKLFTLTHRNARLTYKRGEGVCDDEAGTLHPGDGYDGLRCRGP